MFFKRNVVFPSIRALCINNDQSLSWIDSKNTSKCKPFHMKVQYLGCSVRFLNLSFYNEQKAIGKCGNAD